MNYCITPQLPLHDYEDCAVV